MSKPVLLPPEFQHRCPCGELGVLMPEEAPHTNAEICKNALASTLKGAAEQNLLDHLEGVRRELTRIQRSSGDRAAVEKHARVAMAELSRGVRLIAGKRP